MEAFSLLKYWRGGGGGGAFNRDSPSNPRATDSSCSFSSSTTTIVTAVTPSSSSDSDDEVNDDGPFFDLEFTIPDDDDDSDSEDQTKNPVDNDAAVAPKVVVVQEWENVDSIEESEKDSDDESEGTAEIKFTISSSSTGDPNNAAFSHPPPANDLFFPIDSSSMLLNAASETIPKFPVSSVLKSATKFRVQMLKFSKSNKSDSRQKDKASKFEPLETKPVQKKGQQQKEEGREDPKPNNKLLTVKLKVEEVMPLISLLFTRDQNSSTNSKGRTNGKANKRKTDGVENISSTSPSNEDEKKFSKDVMNKYLKKVKPLYVRVSKRYGDKLRFSGQLSFPKSTAPPDGAEKQPAPVVQTSEGAAAEEAQPGGMSNVLKNQKQGNLQAGLRVVCKHLGKSRSASASVPATGAAPEASRRQDDSLLQQQDGIQSAILHCKRSFNASRGGN